MDNALELYHRILFGNLCPWARDQHVVQKYQQLLHDLREEVYLAQPLYEVDFPKSVLPKRQYFAAMIQGEAVRFLNALHEEMDAAFNESERSFFVHDALNTLDRKLERVAFVIGDKGLDLDFVLHPNKHRKLADPCLADAAYIVHFLKFQLVRLYMEVQHRYEVHLEREVVSREDIHLLYFREAAPEPSFIVTAPTLYSERVDTSFVAEAEEVFEPRMHDTRVPEQGVLRYDDIVADRTKFARLERALFDNMLIDKEYQFQKKPRGNIVKMSAVYMVSFKKGYYQKHYFKGKRRIALTAKEVQAFLNHRYNTDIDKQFRNFKDEEVLNAYLDKEVWIALLPHS